VSVYFITARQVGMVKIGCAFNPRRRLDTMQCGCPIDLALEAWVAGDYTEEREFHSRFKDLRVRGEWFNLSLEIETIIAANPVPTTKFSTLFLKKAREMQGKRPDAPPHQLSGDAKRYAAAMAEMHAAQTAET
jgi:hypothetical protein